MLIIKFEVISSYIKNIQIKTGNRSLEKRDKSGEEFRRDWGSVTNQVSKS